MMAILTNAAKVQPGSVTATSNESKKIGPSTVLLVRELGVNRLTLCDELPDVSLQKKMLHIT